MTDDGRPTGSAHAMARFRDDGAPAAAGAGHRRRRRGQPGDPARACAVAADQSGFRLVAPPLATLHRQCGDGRLGGARAARRAAIADPLDFAARPRWPLDADDAPGSDAGRKGPRHDRTHRHRWRRRLGHGAGPCRGARRPSTRSSMPATPVTVDAPQPESRRARAISASRPTLPAPAISPVAGATDMVILAVPAQDIRAAADGARAVRRGRTSRSSSRPRASSKRPGKRLQRGRRRDHAGGRDRGASPGPSFAADVAKGLPTAVTIAAGRLRPRARALPRPRRAVLPALCRDRHRRRRARRRAEERPRHRRRHRRRPRPRRQRQRRARRARLCRDAALCRSALAPGPRR